MIFFLELWGVAQGTIDYILVAVRFTTWIQKFLKDSLFTVVIATDSQE